MKQEINIVYKLTEFSKNTICKTWKITNFPEIMNTLSIVMPRAAKVHTKHSINMYLLVHSLNKDSLNTCHVSGHVLSIEYTESNQEIIFECKEFVTLGK